MRQGWDELKCSAGARRALPVTSPLGPSSVRRSRRASTVRACSASTRARAGPGSRAPPLRPDRSSPVCRGGGLPHRASGRRKCATSAPPRPRPTGGPVPPMASALSALRDSNRPPGSGRPEPLPGLSPTPLTPSRPSTSRATVGAVVSFTVTTLSARVSPSDQYPAQELAPRPALARTSRPPRPPSRPRPGLVRARHHRPAGGRACARHPQRRALALVPHGARALPHHPRVNLRRETLTLLRIQVRARL